jgi:N-acetylglucosaminyl-diphospho-decaprenol L-rhamnosyltransferase
MPRPDVSIVIIEYYSIEEVNLCISSIKRNLASIDHEIIVSSNSCYDHDQQDEINRLCTGAIWTFNEKNGGFAYGMNQGLARSNGRYLAIVNPDAAIINGFHLMMEFMEAHPEAGAIGPRIIDADGSIQDNCRPYVSLQSYIYRQFRRMIFMNNVITNKGFDYNQTQTVDWLAGAFIMVRRDAYELTNGLDNRYFMYAEDLDWCTRIRQCGYEIVYFPHMKIEYSGSRSARRINNYTWIFIKSHFRYWVKFGFFYGYPKRRKIKYELPHMSSYKLNTL